MRKPEQIEHESFLYTDSYICGIYYVFRCLCVCLLSHSLYLSPPLSLSLGDHLFILSFILYRLYKKYRNNIFHIYLNIILCYLLSFLCASLFVISVRKCYSNPKRSIDIDIIVYMM